MQPHNELSGHQKIKGNRMKWKLRLSILVLPWLMVGCQTFTTPEEPIQTTLQATNLTASITTTSRPTTTPTAPEVPVTPVPTVDIAATVIAISPSRVHSSFPSPDGQWRAEVVIYDCVQLQGNIDTNAVERLKLIGINNETETNIESVLLACGGVGAGGLGGLLWSPNNRYFYYTDAREGYPDGGCGYWARPIKRVNVESQKVEAIGGGHISPDKRKLAFWQDKELVIWDLDEGEMARVPATMPEAFGSQIAWSPDSQSLVYLQTELDCVPSGYSYVTRLDLSGMVQTLLLESKEPSFRWLAWDAPYRISLVDYQGDTWRYSLVSQELTRVP